MGCNPGVCLNCTAALPWGADHVPPSDFTRQPPKVKETFCKVYLWDTSLFCILDVCEKNDQLPLLPCPLTLGSAFFLTRSWPTSPTVQLQGPGRHLIPFSPWIPEYDIGKHSPTSLHLWAVAHAALQRKKAEGSIIKTWLGGSQIIPT